ncbi:hypothetical protein B9Z55_006752 [Caenorhabditis nigoni]|nr:hypothetical protein B9Z55_006752 [Caenorhabditis nigoni]
MRRVCGETNEQCFFSRHLASFYHSFVGGFFVSVFSLFVEHIRLFSSSFLLLLKQRVSENDMRTFEIYTDGCARNNGRYGAYGGWGVVCPFNRSLDCYGFYNTGQQTNNRYELKAIKEALKIARNMRGRAHFNIFADSKYAINALTVWIHSWEERGWLTCKGTPVKNMELIQSIDDMIDELGHYGKTVELIYVKAHGSNVFNNEADGLAKRGAEENNIHESYYY